MVVEDLDQQGLCPGSACVGDPVLMVRCLFWLRSRLVSGLSVPVSSHLTSSTYCSVCPETLPAVVGEPPASPQVISSRHEVAGSFLLFCARRLREGQSVMTDWESTVSTESQALDHTGLWVEGNREDGYLWGTGQLTDILSRCPKDTLRRGAQKTEQHRLSRQPGLHLSPGTTYWVPLLGSSEGPSPSAARCLSHACPNSTAEAQALPLLSQDVTF
ncbi:inositol-trisphosphate 3-kinase C-like isoform X1 [Lates japonicus]|uniref:Inositol-trisphosphate 3-kinase C-like isoform X1 n=1 Tax=Lates japonicus TaxID=270547 RepID=A0AAD3M3J0_LATJO|nr:inositol-trisphosphate 3-kinase C-like isoform X1 [Lates japonicus]